MNIVGKHVVITGGASGIGLALMRQLYDNNDVSVIARPSGRLEELRRAFDRVNVYEADLADLGAVEKAADLLVKSEKKIDVLISNAAVQYTPHFLGDDFQYESIRREIDINFTSVCTLIYLLMPSLMQSNPAIILNINSGLGLAPKTDSAIYCATKGALNILSQSLGYQLENTNIKVKQVFLPLVDTAMTRGRGKNKLTAEEVAAEIIRGISSSKSNIYIGKVKALRLIYRLSPSLAQKIMKAG